MTHEEVKNIMAGRLIENILKNWVLSTWPIEKSARNTRNTVKTKTSVIFKNT